ncbi:MAG: enoyl-CoA hydratase/isomerase family protein, partial [Calditrichaeota bacterium]
MEKIKEMYSHQNSVLTILLNHPKGNVLDRIMMNEILEVLGHAGENPGLKCIVFQGAGEHFSYGASVEEHQKSEIAGMLKTFHQIFYTLIDLGIPT